MMLTESNRTELIGQIASMLQEPTVPAETRAAGLTLIGWLARRMPHDCCAAVRGLQPTSTRRRAARLVPELRRAR
jgi:hypothetical protein